MSTPRARQVCTGSADSCPRSARLNRYSRVAPRFRALKVGCPEEVAFRMGFIDREQLANLAQPLRASGYGQYLLELLDG